MSINNIVQFMNPAIAINSMIFKQISLKAWDELQRIFHQSIPQHPEYCDEVVSIVLQRLYKRRNQPAPIQFPKSYIKQAVLNAYIDIYRRDKRQRSDPQNPNQSTLSLDSNINENQTLLDIVVNSSNESSNALSIELEESLESLYQHLQHLLYNDIRLTVGQTFKYDKGRNTFLSYSQYLPDFRDNQYSPSNASEKRKFDRQRDIFMEFLEAQITASRKNIVIESWIQNQRQQSQIQALEITSERERRKCEADLAVATLYKYIHTSWIANQTLDLSNPIIYGLTMHALYHILNLEAFRTIR